jgi:hypothetical protein
VKREEKRLRKKKAWLRRRKEAKAAAMASKSEAAKAGGPTPTWRVKEREKGSEAEAADSTLLGRVAALEKRLDEQERGEERRVKEAYGVGMEAQARKSVVVFDKLSERSEARQRKLTWELQEERRKNQRQQRKAQGIVIKDRLTVGGKTTTPLQPPIRAGPQWRN